MKNTPEFGFPQFEDTDNYNVGDLNQGFVDVENTIKDIYNAINNLPTLVQNTVDKIKLPTPKEQQAYSQKDSSGSGEIYEDEFYVIGNDDISKGEVIITLEKIAQETITSYGKFTRMNKLWLPGIDLALSNSTELDGLMALMQMKNVSWVTVNGMETTSQYQFEFYFNYLTDKSYMGLSAISKADTINIITNSDIVTASKKLSIAIDKSTGSVEYEIADSDIYSGIGSELGCEYNPNNISDTPTLNGRCFKFINLPSITIDGIEEDPMISISSLVYEAGKPNIPNSGQALTIVKINDVVLENISFTLPITRKYDISDKIIKDAWNYLSLESNENVKFKVSRYYKR